MPRTPLAERILGLFCKSEVEGDRRGYEVISSRWTTENALSTLRDHFPEFDQWVIGRRVLDYGCGDGFQVVALAKTAAEVLGVEIEAARLHHARSLAAGLENVKFVDSIVGKHDIAISLNAMEHFIDPKQSLIELRDALTDGGKILMSFGPPWLAPYGAHMYFFCSLPWVHLLFPEHTVMSVRRRYRGDGALHYEPGMNRMTLRRFEQLVHECGLRIEQKSYRCVNRLDVLAHIPYLREFFVNEVIAVLARAQKVAAVGRSANCRDGLKAR